MAALAYDGVSADFLATGEFSSLATPLPWPMKIQYDGVAVLASDEKSYNPLLLTPEGQLTEINSSGSLAQLGVQ